MSRRRITTFSPQMVGALDTRTSSARPSTSVANWPSWGRRRSTMFIPAWILILLTTAGPISEGTARTSCRAPSMRKRILTRRSWGSTCTSEALSRRAWVMIRFTICTTGASSVAVACCSGTVALRRAPVAAKAWMWLSMAETAR